MYIYIYIYIYIYVCVCIYIYIYIYMTYFKNYQVTQVISIFSLRQAYAKLTSQAWLRILTFLFAYAELTPSLRVKRTCKTVASEKLPGTLRVKRGSKSNCLRQPYANLPSQAGCSTPWPARRLPPHFGIFRLRDAYVMLTGCLREFSSAAILAKNILKSN